jgi:hypothetical protein
MRNDELDDRVHDAVALDEIDLYSDVLSAVAAADRRLTDEELDAVLGLCRQPGAGSAEATGTRANMTSVSQCVKPSDS